MLTDTWEEDRVKGWGKIKEKLRMESEWGVQLAKREEKEGEGG